MIVMKTIIIHVIAASLKIVFVFVFVHFTGQNLLPRGKGHKRTSMSHSKVPHLTHPPITYERQPQHRDHPSGRCLRNSNATMIGLQLTILAEILLQRTKHRNPTWDKTNTRDIT